MLANALVRKRTQQARRESEERYRKLIEDAYDGICIIQDALFGFVNHQLSDMLGYTVEEMVGTPFSPCIHPDVRHEAQRTFEAFMQGKGTAESYESVLQRRDGARVEVEIVGSVILYAGREAGLLTVRDVTERNRVRRALAEQQLAVVAASRMSALGIMASGLAHEINNPLAIISGSSEQLRDILSWEPFDQNLALDQCERILRHAQRIGGIVKGLRTFSRDGSNDPFEEASLQTIVEEALDLCTARFDAHDIALAVDTIPDDLKIECRAVQISQVLINLLSNAYDAVEKLPGKWVRIEVRDRGDAVELAVTDSGGGMPEAIREKALEPFFTTKAVGKGTGLGLSIAIGIVESHHGTLTIDAASANTRVVVRLPKTQPGDRPHGGAEHA
jgi:PAS domain S-box-containing protein